MSEKKHYGIISSGGAGLAGGIGVIIFIILFLVVQNVMMTPARVLADSKNEFKAIYNCELQNGFAKKGLENCSINNFGEWLGGLKTQIQKANTNFHPDQNAQFVHWWEKYL